MADFKPNDFQLGVVELFSVLLPGATLVASIIIACDGYRPNIHVAAFDVAGAGWVAFVLGSYAVGHFVFEIASNIDDPIYRRYRESKWPRVANDAYSTATRLREAQLPCIAGTTDLPMNTFIWSKASLMLGAPGAFADVLRYEADSKFFRSLIVVLPVAGAVLALRGLYVMLPLALLLTYLAFIRYAQLRHKSTEWAYCYAIVLQANNGRTVEPTAAPEQRP